MSPECPESPEGQTGGDERASTSELPEPGAAPGPEEVKDTDLLQLKLFTRKGMCL